jgi:hypothetical protein
MTNEQLAILIRNYASRLDRLVKRLDIDMPESAERHLKWQRKDGKAELIPWKVEGNSDFEQVPIGKYICLDGLRQFSMDLRTHVDELITVTGCAK